MAAPRWDQFPVTWLVFILCCLFMLYSSVTYAVAVKPTGLIVLICVVVLGDLLYWLTQYMSRKPGAI